MITENLSTLKIHKLTKAQYERELAAGNIDENALYLTPNLGDDDDTSSLEQSIKSLKYYGDASKIPSDVSYFTFTTNNETMTAEITPCANQGNIYGDIVVPYEYVVDDKVYTVTSARLFEYYGVSSWTLPNTLKYVMMVDCNIVGHMIIPDGVEELGNFEMNHGMTAMTFPKSLQTTESWIISQEKLDIYYKGSAIEWAQVNNNIPYFDEKAVMHYDWCNASSEKSIELIKYYGDSTKIPSSIGYFTFITNDEDMTAAITTNYNSKNNATGEIVIPYEYVVGDKVYTVTSLELSGYYNVSSWTFPNTLKSIALPDCNVKGHVIIPDGVETLGNFDLNYMTAMTLPKSLTATTQWNLPMSDTHIFYKGSEDDWKLVNNKIEYFDDRAIMHYDWSYSNDTEAILSQMVSSLKYYGDMSVLPNPSLLQYFEFTQDFTNMTVAITNSDISPSMVLGKVVIPYEYIHENGSVYTVTSIDLKNFDGISDWVLPNTLKTVSIQNSIVGAITIPEGVTNVDLRNNQSLVASITAPSTLRSLSIDLVDPEPIPVYYNGTPQQWDNVTLEGTGLEKLNVTYNWCTSDDEVINTIVDDKLEPINEVIFSEEVESVELTMIDGKFIYHDGTSGGGESQFAAAQRSEFIPVEEGEVYKLTTIIGANVPAVSFYSTNVLSVSYCITTIGFYDSSIGTAVYDDTFTVPSDAKYMIINAKQSASTYTPTLIQYKSTNLRDKIEDIEGYLTAEKEIPQEITIVTGKFIQPTGANGSYASSQRTEMIPVTHGERYIINTVIGLNVVAVAFYSTDVLSSSNCVGVVGDISVQSAFNEIVTVPDGANFMIVSAKSIDMTPTVTKIEYIPIGEKVIELDDRLDTSEATYANDKDYSDYEKVCLKKRLLKAEKGNDFVWGKFDKSYFVFIHDDTNDFLVDTYNAFHNKGVPFGAATIVSRLKDTVTDVGTKKTVLENMVADGGEVLCHYGGDLLDTTEDDVWYEKVVSTKRALEENGFTVRGLILADSSARNSNKGERFCRTYYDYADKVGTSLQYNLGRTLLGGYATLDDFKAKIDTCAQTPGLYAFGFHSTTSESWITQSSLEEMIDYILSKGDSCEITTYSNVFDTIGTTKSLKYVDDSISEEAINAKVDARIEEKMGDINNALKEIAELQQQYMIADGNGVKY